MKNFPPGFVLFSLSAILPAVSYAQIVHGIAAGNHHNLVICQNGTSLQTWGRGTEGQLGNNGTPTTQSTAVTVVSVSGACWTPTPPLRFIDVACGDDFSMALSNVGTDAGCGSLPGGIVFAWGYNGYGQIGDGGTINRLGAKRVGGAIQGLTVVAIAAGGNHSLALISGGTSMYTWGRNDFGQCDNGNTTSPQASPVAVSLAALGGRTITKISAGSYHSMVLCSDGTVWTWGYNASGQLGDGTIVNQSTPVSVNLAALGGRTVTAIAGVGRHSLALCSDGTVWTWGNNSNGELGDGTSGTDRLTPVQVLTGASGCATNLCNITAIGTGNGFPNTSIALKSDGTVWTWGKDDLGMLGSSAVADGSNGLTPVQMDGMTSISAVAVGGQHTLLGKNNGTLWNAGDGLNGEMGNITLISQSTAVLATTVCTSILPVELFSFTASYRSGEVQCEWSTASEINNDYFLIEQSKDGNNWDMVGIIQGTGNSSSIRNYTFTDAELHFSTSTTLYYRLKQFDFDGKFEYFGPVAVAIAPVSDCEIVIQNPSVENKLDIRIISASEVALTVNVLDCQGKLIVQKRINAGKGSNFFSFELNGVANGTYFVKVYDAEKCVYRKFAKL